jgi:hypothetical protein
VFEPAGSDRGGLSLRGERLLPGVDFRTVREAVSMRDVLELVGFVARETHGDQLNQLDLWAAVTKTDLHAATIDLCRRIQIDVPWIGQR